MNAALLKIQALLNTLHPDKWSHISPRALANDITATNDITALPADGGAYLLALKLPAPYKPANHLKATPPKPAPAHHPRNLTYRAGLYIYAGNAYGPGGLRARLKRHFKNDKRPHWHIDWLTSGNSAHLTAYALPGAQECALISALLESGNFAAPFPHFGASDCKTCPAHLLKFVE